MTMMTMVLLSIIAVSQVALVQSFSLHPSFYSGKEMFTMQGQQKKQSRVFVTSIQKQQEHLATKLSVAMIDSENDGDSDSDSDSTATATNMGDDGYDGLGEYDPSENLPQTQREVPNVGNPQLRVKEKDWSVTNILKELAAINQQGPQKYCILGTRHCSYLHQQIIELLYVCIIFPGTTVVSQYSTIQYIGLDWILDILLPVHSYVTIYSLFIILYILTTFSSALFLVFCVPLFGFGVLVSLSCSVFTSFCSRIRHRNNIFDLHLTTVFAIKYPSWRFFE